MLYLLNWMNIHLNENWIQILRTLVWLYNFYINLWHLWWFIFTYFEVVGVMSWLFLNIYTICLLLLNTSYLFGIWRYCLDNHLFSSGDGYGSWAWFYLSTSSGFFNSWVNIFCIGSGACFADFVENISFSMTGNAYDWLVIFLDTVIYLGSSVTWIFGSHIFTFVIILGSSYFT